MSIEPVANPNPFDPAHLDEETELRALARSLELAHGFTLLFVRCNQPDQRRRLISSLQSRLPQLNLQVIHFSEPIIHLLRELQERLEGSTPNAIFVTGLEYSLPTATDAHATNFVANLNASRNSFPEAIPCPLVLCLPEYALTAIARGAPDFFSVRSGVYFFASSPGDTRDFVESLTSGEGREASNLALQEKLERIAARPSILADYEALPDIQRDRQRESRVHAGLGHFLYRLGKWSMAETS